MFKFPPNDSALGQIWREKCKIKLENYEKNLLICENHFVTSDIGLKKLKKHAEPTLLLPENDCEFDDCEMFDIKPPNESFNVDNSSTTNDKNNKLVRFYRDKYNKLLIKYKKLRNEKFNQRFSTSKIISAIDKLNTISKENKTFCKLLLCPKPKQYTKDAKELAQNIYYVSQSAYIFLRNKLNLNLPHISTLIRWAPIKSLQPGFQNSAFEIIKQKCSELKPKEKNNMILLVDEMAIRSELRYNSKLDIVEGFEDNGFCRTNVMANSLCVFMLRSMFSSWSIVINFFFSKNGLTSEELKQIILKNLNIIISLGLRVKVLTCDQGSSNRKCFTELGVSSEKPFFVFQSSKVFCLYDFPHLIKSLRNGWMSCDMETMDGVVSFEVVRKLWEIENGSTTKMCTKLTRQHIYPNSFEKMKVKFATQVFSHTVEAAIQTVNNTCEFKDISKEVSSSTASFIGKIKKIFDCLNSSCLYSKNKFKSTIQLNSELHEFINYFKTYLDSMHFVDKNKKSLFLRWSSSND